MGAIEEQGQNELAWRDFMRGHGGDIEDALLPVMAEYQAAHPTLDVARPTWGEVKNVKTKGPIIEFLDPIDDTTEMRFWRATAEDGTVIEGFIPVVLPDDGLKVKIDGVEGVLYLHPDDEVHLDETEPAPEEADEEEQKRLMAMSEIAMKLVVRGKDRRLYGIALSDEFRLSLVEAWKHVDHEDSPCKETAETYLTRLVVQVVEALAQEGTE